MHTGKTYLIKLMDVDLLVDGVGVSEIATHSYHHGWFSQGLTWDGEYLFETVNNLGIDRVEVLEIKSWIDGVSSKPCSVTSFAFAGYAGEDLANDGYSMWSSDESSYKFYKLENYRAILPSESPCYSIV
jgi:glutamine cyclotransferase